MPTLDALPAAAPWRSGGVALHARRFGEGPRLVLLHGGPGLDHHVLLPLAIPLAGRFEVLLPDLPGHGRSHAAGAGLPDLDTVLERTTRWITGLEPAAAILVGHSLGAWLTREMLARRRIRPRAAVLLSSPVASDRGRDKGPTRAWIAARRRTRDGRDAALAREFLEACTEDMEAAPSPLFVASLSRSRLRSPQEYVGLLGQLRRSLGAALRTVQPGCPVLVLAGEADRVCPPEDARRLAAATAGAVSRILAGAGHVPFAADADPVARAIFEFLDAAPGPG
jgi:pimeloyl-ACP methyl ester carboxylesterase